MIRINFPLKEQKNLLPFYFLVSALILASINFFFFWDKDILNSRHAFWYLEHGFSILQPSHIDSGHPPVMGLLLAFLWKTFGISLAVGHLAMLPFALGLVWEVYRFTGFFIKSPSVYWALLLVLIDTSLLTQFVILTGDLLTLLFFFLSINSILYKRRISLIFALICLAVTSSRGTISLLVVGVFDLFLMLRKDKPSMRKLISLVPCYLPSVIISAAYLIYHYAKTGWVGYDPDGSNWGGLFELVDFKGIIRNLFIVGWRLIDFGRLFLWITGLYFLYLLIRKKIQLDDKIIVLSALFIIAFVIYTPFMVIYKGLSGHRYILPLYVIFSVLISYILFVKLNSKKLKRAMYVFLLVGLISGNFWVYPDHIAKGWDATLAHIPYYKLRRQMIQFIDSEGIEFDKVGTEVPNASPLKFIDLVDDERSFTKKNLNECEYIFYSNIYNTFTDEFIQELKSKWTIVEEYKLVQVRVTLYKNPDIP